MKLELVAGLFKNSKFFTLIFILNFALGIGGIFFLEDFKGLLKGSLETKSKTLLGSELAISSRFPIAPETRQQAEAALPKTSKVFVGLSLNSMVASKARSRLVQVVRLGEGFPFYGGLELSTGKTYPKDPELPEKDSVWIQPELLAQLEVKEGDSIRIGTSEFRIGAVIKNDSLKTNRFGGFIPRIYMTVGALERAGLLQEGSTAQYSLNYTFEQKFSLTQLEEIKSRLKANVGPSVSVTSPRDASDQVSRMTTLIADFLSLISLVCLFLSFVSLFYLYSGFLLRYRSDLKIFLDLGITKISVFQIVAIHLFSMLLLSTTFIFILARLLAPYAQNLIVNEIKMDLTFASDVTLIIKSLAFLVLLTPAMAGPLFINTLSEKPTGALRNSVLYTPLALLLIALSASVTTPAKIGFFFAVGLMSVAAVVYGLGYFLIRRQDRSGLGENLSRSLAIKSLVRKTAFSVPVGTALVLSAALFSLAPQICGSLLETISLDRRGLPRFFLFDIQQDQLQPLKSFFDQKGAGLASISPLIRARVLSRNGKGFANLAPGDDQDAPDTQNTTVNLSYRSNLYATEKIIEGAAFTKNPNPEALAEVSVEERYASRRGIKLGDKLMFDILGLELEAKIVNIRSVKWTDFTPNFFLLFNEGALNDAPKIFLATVPQTALDPNALVLEMGEKFPNVSVINVEEVISEIKSLIAQVSKILNGASVLCSVLGLIMILIIIHHQMTIRRTDIVRLKMIGVTLSQIRRSILNEFGWISAVSTLLGLSISVVATWIVSYTVFDGQWSFQSSLILPIFPIITIFITGAALMLVDVTLRQKESVLFEEA